MPVTWLTGNSGSGKTTLARKMIAQDGGVLLDGDAMRTVWTLGLTREDRVEHNLRIARLAKVLDDQGLNVVVATICPYAELRDQVQRITRCRFVYLEPWQPRTDYPYEGPGAPRPSAD